MIELTKLSLRRGARELLSDVSLRVSAGERIGIVGPNGCGKSSLFELIAGQLSPDQGDCRLPTDWPIAQMDQEVPSSPGSALDYVLDGDAEYRLLQCAIDEANDGTHLAELHARFEALCGWSAPSRAHELLAGLGFDPDIHNQGVGEFSGGWRTRLALARTLMTPSELLLLDEPTNHLDLDAIDWLESWLTHYPGTLLLISHDRDFLDAVVTRIVAFENRRLDNSRGNYTAWERQRAERLANQQAQFDKQQERIHQIEAFVARFRAKATKAKQAQSRLRELERMTRIDAAHVDSPFRFRLPCADKVSTPLLALQQVSLGYENTTVLSDITMSVLPGQRIGLLGPNGAGKSTLMRCLVGALPAAAGSRQAGDNLRCGHFAQHQLDALDGGASPLGHLRRLDADTHEQLLRDFLGGYGFPGDMASAAVAQFSGGERARLALALLAWQQPNLLLLDEPTNHLDLEMRHALVLALQEYPGAMVLVSHDRHLLRNTVDEFWLVHNGCAEPFDGDLDAYQVMIGSTRQLTTGAGEGGSSKRRDQRRDAAKQRDVLRPLRQTVAEHERDVSRWQTALTEIESRLAEPEVYLPESSEQLALLLKDQGRVRRSLAGSEEAWLEAFEALENALG